VKDLKNMAYVQNVINQILESNDANLAMLSVYKKVFLNGPVIILK
jgi:hypothetical protein